LKKPDWDGAKLFVNGELIKRYKNPAIHQKKFLIAFKRKIGQKKLTILLSYNKLKKNVIKE